MQVKNVYNEQYQSEQAFMILFYNRYANMINKMKTLAEIWTNIRISSFLTPAHYIFYQINVLKFVKIMLLHRQAYDLEKKDVWF